MPEQLTQRQRELMKFIESHVDLHGYPPTLREIGAALGVTSTNGIADHLKALEKKGYIDRKRLSSRAIRILRRVDQWP